MKAERPCLTVLVLTEDTSDDAHPALVTLRKKAFRILRADCQTHRIAFEPQNDTARRYVVGNAWKGRGPRGHGTRGRARFHLVELHQLVATKLLEREPPGIVVFHLDGDRPWSRREESENAREFEARIRDRVRVLLADHLRDEGAADRALSGLRPLAPFYSIEAWLYQNLDEARRIGAELGAPDDLRAQLDAWAADRASLDEVEKPKAACRLGARFNLRLATNGWPAEDVYLTERSFHAAVEGLATCERLREALARTAEPPAPPAPSS